MQLLPSTCFSAHRGKLATLVFMVCAVLPALASCNCYAQPFNTNLANKLQFTLNSLVSMFANTKGMSAAVYYPGQGVWTGTSGISYAGQPITANMTFGIASNSKLFTAVAILKLAENNVLNLNDAIGMWIPTFPNVNPNVTIRQLLNHTSGVSDAFFTTGLLDAIAADPTHVYTPEEVLTWLPPPLFNPGMGYGYSNTNYILAGMVVKSASGIAVAQHIRNYLLNPLQLNSMFYDIEEAEINPIAHRWQDEVDIHTTPRISLNTAGGPAGSLFATAADMVQWYNALMSGGVLNANSFTEMTTFASPGNYGLGLGLFTFFGNTCWGHGGSTTGYRSRTIYDPVMKAAVCGLSNSSPSAVDGITAKLYEVLLINLPAKAGIISGLTTVCQGQNAVTYTVPPILNATTYEWTLPTGATGTSNTNSITVDYGATAVSGNITVKGGNSYGLGTASSQIITVNPTPNPVILGVTDNCLGTIQTYTATSGISGSTYVWTVTNGTIISGCTSASSTCTVQWQNPGNGSVSVSVTNP